MNGTIFGGDYDDDDIDSSQEPEWGEDDSAKSIAFRAVFAELKQQHGLGLLMIESTVDFTLEGMLAKEVRRHVNWISTRNTDTSIRSVDISYQLHHCF